VTPVPIFDRGLTRREVGARVSKLTSGRGYVRRRDPDERPSSGDEMMRHGSRAAANELGGLFIDRLYESGEDLVSEGARMLAQSGDDEG